MEVTPFQISNNSLAILTVVFGMKSISWVLGLFEFLKFMALKGHCMQQTSHQLHHRLNQEREQTKIIQIITAKILGSDSVLITNNTAESKAENIQSSFIKIKLD